MYKGNSFLAIIPARSGSKRLADKNSLDLLGKPLIGWTIEAATNSKYVDYVVVSTDSQKILNIAEKFGIKAPFKRPKELACDNSSSMDTVIHAITELDNIGKKYDYIILLQPTSPLRTFNDIDKSIEQLIERSDEAVISVTKSKHSPLWSNILPENKSMSDFINKDFMNIRSQDLPEYYQLNGAIYLIKTTKVFDQKNPSFFLSEKISAYVMDENHSVDIDTKIDFKLAEIILKNES
jgi:CMP-N,N'-diacetyllegionaminic acid synthase